VLCAVLTAHTAATRLRRACSQTAGTVVTSLGWAARGLRSCYQASAGRRVGQQCARRGGGAGRRHAGAAARAAARTLAARAGLVPARAACAAGRGRARARHHPAHGPGRPPSAGRSARLPPGRRPLPAERCCGRGALLYHSCWPRRACLPAMSAGTQDFSKRLTQALQRGQLAHAAGRALSASSPSGSTPMLRGAALGSAAWPRVSSWLLVVSVALASGTCRVAAEAGHAECAALKTTWVLLCCCPAWPCAG